MIVLEDGTGRGSRRCLRVQELIRGLRSLAEDHKIRSASFSRAKIQKAFAERVAKTKHEIAGTIAQRFPELAARVPPRRKAWMSEVPRMHIFDAMSLALTFFHFRYARTGDFSAAWSHSIL